MAQLLMIIGAWLGVIFAAYVVTVTPSYSENCPRWLIVTIRASAASCGAMIILRLIFIHRSAESGELVSAILGSISVGGDARCVAARDENRSAGEAGQTRPQAR